MDRSTAPVLDQAGYEEGECGPTWDRRVLGDREWLYERYVIDRMTLTEIGHLVDVSQFPVQQALRRVGIPARSRSEAKKGRPSTTIWTAEMREALAAKRRGELNPMYGTVSPWRGQHKPTDQITRHYGRGRARIIHPAQPCEICGKENGERHHRNGNATDNSKENIAFYCRYHHLHVGHNGHWGMLNLPEGMSDQRLAGPPLTKKPPMTSEQLAALSEVKRANGRRLMTADRARSMAQKALAVNPMTLDRAKRMAIRAVEARRTPEARARRSEITKAYWARRKASRQEGAQ